VGVSIGVSMARARMGVSMAASYCGVRLVGGMREGVWSWGSGGEGGGGDCGGGGDLGGDCVCASRR